MSLSVCLSCSRHVRESLCPFCGAAVPPAPPAAVRPRVARVALLGGAAVLVAACGSNNPSPVPLYGGVVVPDASASDAATQDEQDAPGPMYGAVPVDAGAGDTGEQ